MDLSDRLSRLIQKGVEGLSPKSQSRWADREHSSGPQLDDLLEGHWVEAAGGLCYVVERSYALEYAHGAAALGAPLTLPGRVWKLFVADDAFPPLRDILFVDTETTGLGRDAGTFCFMVGTGRYEGDRFVVRQFFMPDYGHEAALLSLVADQLYEAGGLVSFNGRAFDLPLLETRYMMQRRDLPGRDNAHLDLLLVARRLWRDLLDSCALSALERDVLGVLRASNDVPGYLIPQIYNDYVQFGEASPIVDVFYHNEVDILSMVTLLQVAGQMVTVPLEQDHPHRDGVALGRLYEGAGRVEEALAAYRAALVRGSAAGAKRLSFLLKRLERYDEAMAVWEGQLGGPHVYPYVELAKQLEHRLGDLSRAHDLACEALRRLDAGEIESQRPKRLREELAHRLARLERRLEKD